ncbi:MAG: hypothetical protein GY782_02130 [Gammaproteobacteria bacterium]|nr:hypothetical protein [Gammaproteobacteria bacterium]
MTAENFSSAAKGYTDKESYIKNTLYGMINKGLFSEHKLSTQHTEAINQAAKDAAVCMKLASIHDMAATTYYWKLTNPLSIFDKIIKMNDILTEEEKWIIPLSPYGMKICTLLLKMIEIKKLEGQYKRLHERLISFKKQYNETLKTQTCDDKYIQERKQACAQRITIALKEISCQQDIGIFQKRYNMLSEIVRHMKIMLPNIVQNEKLNMSSECFYDLCKAVYTSRGMKLRGCIKTLKFTG